MRRVATIAFAVLVILPACGDDDTAATTNAPTAIASTTTAADTSSSTSTTTTTSVAPSTTRTSFESPPGTDPNPERGPFVGIWRWAGTHTRYIQLFEHGVIAAGDIVDGTLQLTRTGEWDIADGMMTVASLELGPDPCGDVPATYEIRIAGQNLVMTLIDDPCAGRAIWLLGRDTTVRTWIPDDA